MSFTIEHDGAASTVKAVLRACSQQIEFSTIFKCELIVTTAYVAMTGYLYAISAQTVPTLGEIGFLAFVVLCAQIAKIMFMLSLDRRGGDARTFKLSNVLVTDGVYGYSRNPAYLATLIQNVTWSLLLLLETGDGKASTAVIVGALLLPFAHFISINRLVIPKEEANLRRLHPEAYAAYANRVNRWIGRRSL